MKSADDDALNRSKLSSHSKDSFIHGRNHQINESLVGSENSFFATTKMDLVAHEKKKKRKKKIKSEDVNPYIDLTSTDRDDDVDLEEVVLY